MTAIALGFFSVLKLATIFGSILAFVWIMRRHGTRQREAAVLTEQEQGSLDQLSRIAEKMERRLDALERILDADHPKWKERL